MTTGKPLLARYPEIMDAAAAASRRHGVTPLVLGDAIEGEARAVAIVMAGLAESAARYGEPARKPCVLLSGGETTVTVKPGSGASNASTDKTVSRPRGGRITECLLALALSLGSHIRLQPTLMLQRCRQLETHCAEHGFPYLSSYAIARRGSALLALGRTEEGLALLVKGLVR